MADASRSGRLASQQREALAALLHSVFLALRAPGYTYFWDSKDDWNDIEKLRKVIRRSAAFGEAFHNLPGFLFQDGLDFDRLEADIEHFLPDRDKKLFLGLVRDIRAMHDDGDESLSLDT